MEYDGIILKPDLDEAIEHYGVLGMKWGVRKAEKNAGERTRQAINEFKTLEAQRKNAKTRREKKLIKSRMKNTYTRLRQAKRYDYGKRLVSNKQTRHKVAGKWAGAAILGTLGVGNLKNAAANFVSGDKTIGAINLALGGAELTIAGVQASRAIKQRYKNVSIEEFRKASKSK